MTHDELLERLHIEQGCPVGDALRAVLELHKPVDCEALDGSQGTMCINCRDGFYPCLTIQTIEWNLREYL